MAYEYARKIKVPYPESWDKDSSAGEKWYRGFMKRHKRVLSLRKPENTSLNRVNSFNAEAVQSFYNNLDLVLGSASFEPYTIWNMDESGFSTVPNTFGKVIAERGSRKVGQITSQERGTLISMALTVNAAGGSIPPFFLFPLKNMQTKFMKHASPGAVGFANGSGYMKQTEFVSFMQHFIKYSNTSKERQHLLLLDNHTSHLSIEALDIAAENGVTLLSFPPHCTHKLQPLDVSVFGPVKSYYETEVLAWHRNHTNQRLEIADIPELACKAIDLALTPTNIKSGFRASGISPYNPNIFTDSDFVQARIAALNQPAEEQVLSEEDQPNIVALDNPPDVGAETEVSTSEASNSRTSTPAPRTSTPLSHASSVSSILDEIGPLKPTTPQPPKSKRGRPAMKSAILTSPENRDELREKRAKRVAAEQKKADKSKVKAVKSKAKAKPNTPKPPAKRAKRRTYSSSSDEDFCIICSQMMPKRLITANSIACKKCDRPVHKTCANILATGFTCENCFGESDDEVDDDEEADE